MDLKIYYFYCAHMPICHYVNLQKTISNKYNLMQADPYNWPFPQRTDTMSLSTINEKDFSGAKKFARQSTFQWHDMQGAAPTKLISEKMNKVAYNLSSYVEPRSVGFKKLEKVSDPLKIDDIQGTKPNAVVFTTKRITDPVAPVYKLPSCAPLSVDEGRPFIRDTLKTDDVVKRKVNYFQRKRGLQTLTQPIPGSHSLARTHTNDGVSRLEVSDINKQGMFKSTRQADPLDPVYQWRDELEKINHKYGKIQGNEAKERHKVVVNKQNTRQLNVGDIDGAYHNSYFDRVHFLDKRRDYRNYMKNDDIERTQASSLKKGITTVRATNPLVPRYKFPGETQIKSIIPYPQ